MRKIYPVLILFTALLSATSCMKEEFSAICPEEEGAVLHFSPEGMFAVETRTAPPHMGKPECKVEFVTVFVFDDATGNLLAVQSSEMDYPDNELRMMLPQGKALDIHTVCNAQDWIETVANRTELENKVIEVTRYDDVFKGKYMMYGSKKVSATEAASKNTAITIFVKRLGSHITFDIKFSPDNTTDRFYLTEIFAYNLPKKSNLQARTLSDGSEFNRDASDAVHQQRDLTSVNDTLVFRQANYFGGVRLTVTNPGKDHYETDFFQFENRRGSLNEDPKWFEMLPDADPLKPQRQQIFKAKYGDSLFTFATYIDIKGTYVTNGSAGEETIDAKYRVYLGSSNDRDFNVRRNGNYHYALTIRACDEIDTRVECEKITHPQLSPTFQMPLDAHYNSVKCFMYAPGDWELYVENPDEHPWLEISFSSNYKPHIAGQPLTEDCAVTRMEGKGRKLEYFYIHTDEYVPYLNGLDESLNDDAEESLALREGTIILKKKATADSPEEITRIPVTQRPGQVVKLTIKEPFHDTRVRYYYVESILEKKNLPWGFETCIDPILMIETNLGWWDGLANTRKLYQSALDPDLFGGDPGYYNPTKGDWRNDPSIKVPETIALGYALTKNRDRDGNGRIDYDEVVWYMPAADEMYEILRVLDQKNIWFENAGDKFWTSQAFSGGSDVLNGRSYYIKTKEHFENKGNILRRGSYHFAMRDRNYNVLCVRLAKECWQGNPDGSIGGNVSTDETWNEEEEIMPGKPVK